jgi:hypothetical protein
LIISVRRPYFRLVYLKRIGQEKKCFNLVIPGIVSVKFEILTGLRKVS